MPVNMDKYLSLRYPEPATILDYFNDPLLILEEPASLREAERATAYRRSEELSSPLEDGVLAPAWISSTPRAAGSGRRRGTHRTLCAENFARSMPDVPLKAIVNAPAHTLPTWGGEVAALLEDIQPLCSGGAAVHDHGWHAPRGGGPGSGPAHQGAERHHRRGGRAIRRDGANPAGAALRRVQPALCQVRALHGAGLRRERRTEKKKAQQRCAEQSERNLGGRPGRTPEPRHWPVCGHPADGRAGTSPKITCALKYDKRTCSMCLLPTGSAVPLHRAGRQRQCEVEPPGRNDWAKTRKRSRPPRS